MKNINEILNQILKLEFEQTDTIQLTDNRFLFVDNWGDKDEKFTSLELNSGYVEDDTFVLDEVLECGTYNFRDEKDVRIGLEYIINCI